jgi:hypothetical protein
MNKKFFAFILSLLVFSKVSIFAALPPFAEDKRIVIQILQDKNLPQYIPYGDVLNKIEKCEQGYIIETNKRVVLALVHYEETEKIGPRAFFIEFQIISGEEL